MYRTLCFILILKLISPAPADRTNLTITVDTELTADSRSDSGCVQELEGDLNVTCMNFDAAIGYVTSLNTSSDGQGSVPTVTIFLPNGIHYITTSTYFGDVDLAFVGLDSKGVRVVCKYYTEPTDINDILLIHTWYFDEATSIQFESIHFENCGFPFRFYAVEQVSIRNCVFT